MKKDLLLLIFGLFSILGYSQLDRKNEIKVNLPYALVGIPEISYEYTLNQTSSIGISTAYSIEKPEKMNTRWVVTPYYRMYFGEGKAKGFFVEPSLVILNQNRYSPTYNIYSPYYTYVSYENIIGTSTNTGYGLAIGFKILNRENYLIEFVGGVSKLFKLDDNESLHYWHPRMGLNIGKRF